MVTEADGQRNPHRAKTRMPAERDVRQDVSGQGLWSHWHAISTSPDPASLQTGPQYFSPACTAQRHGRWAHRFCSTVAMMFSCKTPNCVCNRPLSMRLAMKVFARLLAGVAGRSTRTIPSGKIAGLFRIAHRNGQAALESPPILDRDQGREGCGRARAFAAPNFAASVPDSGERSGDLPGSGQPRPRLCSGSTRSYRQPTGWQDRRSRCQETGGPGRPFSEFGGCARQCRCV